MLLEHLLTNILLLLLLLKKRALKALIYQHTLKMETK